MPLKVGTTQRMRKMPTKSDTPEVDRFEECMEVPHICLYCKKFYLNDHDGTLCSWNNREVPTNLDFCSRWEKK